ncbi:hypothetical protein LXL04_033981 [Taraxacum kok-saghyz]
MRFSSHNFLPSAMGIGTDRGETAGKSCRSRRICNSWMLNAATTIIVPCPLPNQGFGCREQLGAAGSKLEKALGDQFPEGERYFGLEIFGDTCYCNSVLQSRTLKKWSKNRMSSNPFWFVSIIFDRWSAFMEDGKVKVLNVENVPSESKVSGGEKLRPSKKHNQKMEQNIQGLKTRERPTIFPFLQINGGSSDYIISRAILSTKNENVDEINDQLIDSGLPPHYLRLKIGCPIILLRDIDHSNGLCNGTRLICKGFQMNVIDAEIAVGHHAGKRVFMPRIPLCPSADDMFPFKLKRKQFPIRLSFAMTINKAQGQTIPNVGVYLPESMFSHGQHYVAFSRGISRENTKVLVKPVKEFTNEGVYTSNVVYREVLHDI